MSYLGTLKTTMKISDCRVEDVTHSQSKYLNQVRFPNRLLTSVQK